MACDKGNGDCEEDKWNIILYESPTSKSQTVVTSSKAAIISQSLKVWLHTPHSPGSPFISWYSSPLIFFFPLWLNHHMADGFFWSGMWRGCRTGPSIGWPLYQQWAGRDWAQSSWLNDFPGEMWFWHWVRLYCHTHRCMEVIWPHRWLSRRLNCGKMMHILSLRAPRCLWRGLHYIVL